MVILKETLKIAARPRFNNRFTNRVNNPVNNEANNGASGGVGEPSHWIAIFGEGLVGGALRDQLIGQGAHVESRHPTPWGHSELALQMRRIQKSLSSKIRTDDMVTFVWAAGRAGFNATVPEADREFQDFLLFLELLNILINEFQQTEFCVQLVSSAGGLFEGQISVHPGAVPKPIRPYGELKLKQERALMNLWTKAQRFNLQNFRLSTVYGPIRAGKRVGLIANLIQNGFLQRVTSISGELATLRDYIHCADVAQVLCAGQLAHGGLRAAENYFLISNKPTSIYEIKSIIEFYIRHKVYINMSYARENSKNITFQEMSPPFGVRAMDIRVGIKDILTHWHGPAQEIVRIKL